MKIYPGYAFRWTSNPSIGAERFSPVARSYYVSMMNAHREVLRLNTFPSNDLLRPLRQQITIGRILWQSA